MITANVQLIADALGAPTPQAMQAILEDTNTVFWVDAQEKEEEIVQACETRLGTGSLTYHLPDSGNRNEMYIVYQQKRIRVPLTPGPADRHLTIFSLNRLLNPDYEIRFFTSSAGMDALAFVALPTNTWQQLEQHFTAFVEKVFYKIMPEPNLFTDPLAILNLKQF